MGGKVPDAFFLPEDLQPLASSVNQALFALFEEQGGTQYLVAFDDILSSYYSKFTFIAPVIQLKKTGAGYVVFLLTDGSKVIEARYKNTTTSMIAVPGVFKATSLDIAVNDVMGEANTFQTKNYYKIFTSLAETDLTGMYELNKVQLNGKSCYMPAAGQLNAVKYFSVKLEKMFKDAGLKSYVGGLEYGSSTQGASYNQYVVLSSLWPTGIFKNNSKTVASEFIPVTDLDVIFNNPEIKPSVMNFEFTNRGGYPWYLGSDGWYSPSTGFVSSNDAILEVTSLSKYKYSRFRVFVEIDAVTNGSFYIQEINMTISRQKYLGLFRSPTVFSFDYINENENSNYAQFLSYLNSPYGVKNVIRLRAEEIDIQKI